MFIQVHLFLCNTACTVLEFLLETYEMNSDYSNILKTSLDTAPPPSAPLPFAHPKRPQRQNLTPKWFVQKTELRES